MSTNNDQSNRPTTTRVNESILQKIGKKLRVLDSHDFFGEIALLNDVPRTATVYCNAPTRLLQLPKHLFSKFVSFAPSIKNR